MTLFHPVYSTANLLNLLVSQLLNPRQPFQSLEECDPKKLLQIKHHLSRLRLLTDVIDNLSEPFAIRLLHMQ